MGGLLFCLPMAMAAPGGSGAGVGSAAAASSGGHAGVSAAPAAHASGGSVGIGRSPIGVGRSSFGAGGGFRSPVVNAGSAYRPGVSGFTGINRNVGGSYAAAGTGFAQRPASTRSVLPVTSVNNAWTDPVSPRVSGAKAASNSRFGRTPYENAPGNAAGQAANGSFRGGRNGNGGYRNHRYYYNNFPYAVYYPYLYNNFGYYGGYGSPGYYGDVSADAGLSTDDTNNVLGAPDFQNTPNNYYSYAAPDQGAPDSAKQPAPDQSLPNAPAVGPQGPSSADQSAAAAPPGPDSLVEAVQNELARRGYFGGKADSMYGPATKEAIRRFQTDQHLPVTGRINEATLHSLNLD